MYGWSGNLRHIYVWLLTELSHSQAGRQVGPGTDGTKFSFAKLDTITKL